MIERLVFSQLSVSVFAKQTHTSLFADHKKLVFFATHRGTILSLVAIKFFLRGHSRGTDLDQLFMPHGSMEVSPCVELRSEGSVRQRRTR